MDFKNILLEDYKKKDSPKKTFKTYECYFVIKLKRRYNKSDLYERIRSVKDVTIVTDKRSDKLDRMNAGLKDQEYNMLQIKFNTYKDPHEKIEEIKNDILKSDKDKDNYKIIGVTGVRPQEKTLNKI